jgi:hypothetical protein
MNGDGTGPALTFSGSGSLPPGPRLDHDEHWAGVARPRPFDRAAGSGR